METKFDPTKLKILKELLTEITENTKLVTRVYSYDGGQPRMKILSQIKRQNGQSRVLRNCAPIKDKETCSELISMLEDLRQFLPEKSSINEERKENN